MMKLKDILFEANENLEIHIYDFDGTTFGSPAKPSWWTGRGWWGNPKSLEPPIVPLKPGNEWWNSSVVSSAKKSISNSNVTFLLLRESEIFVFSHSTDSLKKPCSIPKW